MLQKINGIILTVETLIIWSSIDKWHDTYSGNTGYKKFNARIGSFIKDCFKKELIKLALKVDFNDRDTKLFYSP